MLRRTIPAGGTTKNGTTTAFSDPHVQTSTNPSRFPLSTSHKPSCQGTVPSEPRSQSTLTLRSGVKGKQVQYIKFLSPCGLVYAL